MQFAKSLLAVAALAAAFSANAVVTGQLRSGPAGSFATLTGSGVVGAGGALSGSVTATITGGTVYSNDLAFADQPAGTVAGNTVPVGRSCAQQQQPRDDALRWHGPGLHQLPVGLA